MAIDETILDEAVSYLIDGNELKAAEILRTCQFDNWDIVDHWMDGNRQLDGILIELSCPRASYETLTNSSHSITNMIEKAIH